MQTGKEDRRVRRTKTLLLQGLIHLMETKEIKDISVKELTEVPFICITMISMTCCHR